MCVRLQACFHIVLHVFSVSGVLITPLEHMLAYLSLLVSCLLVLLGFGENHCFLDLDFVTSLLTHRLVLLCVYAYCFIFWDLPGDVLAAPESAIGVILRCRGNHLLSHAGWNRCNLTPPPHEIWRTEPHPVPGQQGYTARQAKHLQRDCSALSHVAVIAMAAQAHPQPCAKASAFKTHAATLRHLTSAAPSCCMAICLGRSCNASFAPRLRRARTQSCTLFGAGWYGPLRSFRFRL